MTAHAGPYAAYCDAKSSPVCRLDIGLIVADEAEVDAMLAERGWRGTRGARTCPACQEPGDPVWAYCGQRAADRKTTTGIPRHALTWTAKLSGAMDAECGVLGRVEVGRWDPADPNNCPDCVRYLAGRAAEDWAVPEEAAALSASDPMGTPSLYAA